MRESLASFDVLRAIPLFAAQRDFSAHLAMQTGEFGLVCAWHRERRSISRGLAGRVHVFTCFLNRRKSGSKPETLKFSRLSRVHFQSCSFALRQNADSGNSSVLQEDAN